MKQINFNDAKHFDYVHIFSTAITDSFIFMVSILKVLVSVTTLPPPFFFTLCMFANFANFFVIQLKSLYITTKNQWNCITICPENLSTCKYWIQPQNNCDKKRKCFFSVSFNGTISNFPLICYSFQIEATFDIFGYTNFMLVLFSISF